MDKFDYNKAVGLKFYTGPMDIDDSKVSDFEFRFMTEDDKLLDEIKDPTGIFTGENIMTCKFFDAEEGVMYVHFDREVVREDLFMFEDSEVIYKKI